MNKKKFAILIVCIMVFLPILAIILSFCFVPRLSNEQRQEIIDTFAGYDNGEVIYSHSDRIFLPDRTIDLSSIKFNGKECDLISCGAESCYAYTQEMTDLKHKSVNLMEISYADNVVKYIDTLTDMPRVNVFGGSHIQDKIYFGPCNGYYYVYDLDERACTTMSKSEVVALKESQTQYEFKVLEGFPNFNHYGIKITDKSTRESKTIKMSDLNTFSEGQCILSLDSYLTNSFFRSIVEKDGDIYILGMITLDTFGSTQHQNVVLKYDFENETLSYYSSMFYAWDETPRVTIL